MRYITCSLEPRWRGGLFLIVMIALAGAIAIQAVRLACIELWGSSADPERVQRAIQLDPQNAKLYFWLGSLRLLQATEGISDVVGPFQKATELDPLRAQYWAGLGRACLVAGDRDCADQAFERVVKLAPMRPNSLREAAAYYTVAGELDKALVCWRRLLQMSPDDAGQVFELATRATGDPELIWRELVRDGGNAILECRYIEYVADAQQYDLAEAFWAETARAGPIPSFSSIEQYLQRLVEHKRFEQAARVWQDLLRMGMVSQAGKEDNNLIFNGHFRQPPLNAGFDWHAKHLSFVALDFADRSLPAENVLRVDFTVPNNVDDEFVYQYAMVTPNQKYVLAAYARSEGITSDSGPRLRVLDPLCSACLDATSEQTLGTTSRRRIELFFVTGPTTQVVMICLGRTRSRTFPMEIKGHFWLDSISLKPAGAASQNIAGDNAGAAQ